MTEAAAIYRRVHLLLRSAKLSGWKISRRGDDDRHWRMTSPLGDAVVIAARPTMGALLDAERGFDRIQRQHLTAGTEPAQPRTEPCLPTLLLNKRL